jgi:hypothetical protein
MLAVLRFMNQLRSVITTFAVGNQGRDGLGRAAARASGRRGHETLMQRVDGDWLEGASLEGREETGRP